MLAAKPCNQTTNQTNNYANKEPIQILFVGLVELLEISNIELGVNAQFFVGLSRAEQKKIDDQNQWTETRYRLIV